MNVLFYCAFYWNKIIDVKASSLFAPNYYMLRTVYISDFIIYHHSILKLSVVWLQQSMQIYLVP